MPSAKTARIYAGGDYDRGGDHQSGYRDRATLLCQSPQPILGPQVLNQLGGAKSKSAQIQIRDLEQALEMYKLDVGRFPNSGEGLEALVRSPGNARGWNGPYLRKDEIPLDPWGNEYQYQFPADTAAGYELISYGSDGRAGGSGEAADVSS